eukprot:scaffold421838_cov79-Attheya_sp.AAC.1
MELTFRQISFGTVYCCVSDAHPTLFPIDVKEHAITCKKGGLILLRHNELSSEWQVHCAQALSPSAVSNEPLIHNCPGQQEGEAGVRHMETLPEYSGCLISQLMGIGLTG